MLARTSFERLFCELQAKPAVRSRHENNSTFDLHKLSFRMMNRIAQWAPN
jgi:hypothetical protein